MNWRVAEGYGSAVAAHAAGLAAILDCPVSRIDHGGRQIRVEASKGTFTADAIVVCVPSALLAEESSSVLAAAAAKSRSGVRPAPRPRRQAVSFAASTRRNSRRTAASSARTDRTATGAYHFRPFGRPMIEGYFGGSLAQDLEATGEDGFFEFAVGELTGVLGSAFADRIKLDPRDGLAKRSLGARIILVCIAWQGRRTRRARGACRRPSLLRRRGLLASRFLDGARSVPHRPRRG